MLGHVKCGVNECEVQNLLSLRGIDDPLRFLTGFVLPEKKMDLRNSRKMLFKAPLPSSTACLRASQKNSQKHNKPAMPRPPIRTTNTPPTLAKPSSPAAVLALPPSSCVTIKEVKLTALHEDRTKNIDDLLCRHHHRASLATIFVLK